VPDNTLSIVVPSLNQARFIRRTLESLRIQKNLQVGELEIVVIDGGSIDGTVEIIREYEPMLSFWISEPDDSQTDALIKGFSVCHGSILGWLCSDDILEPWTVREVLDFFTTRSEVRFVYGDAEWIDDQDRLIRPKREIPFNWFIWKHDHNYIPQPAAFWRTELYQEVGGLDPAFIAAMDGNLWAQFALRTSPVHVPRPWAKMRFYAEQKNLRLRSRSDHEDRLTRTRLGIRYENRLLVKCRYVAAKSLRVLWKLFTNCYG